MFGREGDPFLSFRSLPQMEALLAGISADGRKLGDNKPFGESLFHGALSAEPCFGHFSPINKPVLASALSLQESPTMFKSTITSASGHSPSAHRPCGGSSELSLES